MKIFFHSEPLMLEYFKKCLRVGKISMTDTVATDDMDSLLSAAFDHAHIIVVAGCAGHACDAAEVAARVKDVNPRAIFLVFSANPALNEHVDGVIPRDVGWQTVISLMSLDLEEVGGAELRELFPNIAWLT